VPKSFEKLSCWYAQKGYFSAPAARVWGPIAVHELQEKMGWRERPEVHAAPSSIRHAGGGQQRESTNPERENGGRNPDGSSSPQTQAQSLSLTLSFSLSLSLHACEGLHLLRSLALAEVVEVSLACACWADPVMLLTPQSSHKGLWFGTLAVL
jgi:hypothetical protein